MSKWRDSLDQAFEKKVVNKEEAAKADEAGRQAALAFISNVLEPAFQEFAEAVESHGRNCSVERRDLSSTIRIEHNNQLELAFSVDLVPSNGKAFPRVTFEALDSDVGRRYRGETMLTMSSGVDSSQISKEAVLEKLTLQYLYDFPRR